jgi:thymidylate synthase (FAD)
MSMIYKSDIKVSVIQQMGDDVAIASAAWVSTGKLPETMTLNDVSNLINYLMRTRHGTPFEHSSITFLVRHRVGFSYNEEGGRYKILEPVFYIPHREREMMKVDDWKPGRLRLTRCKSDEVYERLIANLKGSYTVSYLAYLNNLKLNIDPGLARDCLPVGIYSSCWVTCNPRSLMHFLSLRTHEPEAKYVSYPLYEIEEAARGCEKVLAEGWPLTYKAFCDNGRVAP